MKKYKLLITLTIILTLFSCTNKEDEISTFMASPTIGQVDLRTLSGWPGGNGTDLEGFDVKLLKNGTVAKFKCPKGEVSFKSRKICNKSGGCDYSSATVYYPRPVVGSINWISQFDQNIKEGMSLSFRLNNKEMATGFSYVSGLICVPIDQVSYWS